MRQKKKRPRTAVRTRRVLELLLAAALLLHCCCSFCSFVCHDITVVVCYELWRVKVVAVVAAGGVFHRSPHAASPQRAQSACFSNAAFSFFFARLVNSIPVVSYTARRWFDHFSWKFGNMNLILLNFEHDIIPYNQHVINQPIRFLMYVIPKCWPLECHTRYRQIVRTQCRCLPPLEAR